MVRSARFAACLLAGSALSTFATAATVTLNGGGAASQQFNYSAPNVNGAPVSEFGEFAALQSGAAFGTYWSTTSGAAQTGLLNNDLTCLSNVVLNLNSGKCSGTLIGGANTVHYAVAESVLTTAQISTWSTSATGQTAAGNLIQIPMLGTGLAIVVNKPGVTANGQIVLSDNDLCGIFSGKITNFDQIIDGPAKFPPQPLTVVYRSDSAGTTFLLTNHLSAVCTTSNSNITFTPGSSLSAQFGTAGVPANFAGVSGLAALANTMAGLEPNTYPAAISYVSPDWTSVDSATSSAKLSNGQPSPLLVAALRNGPHTYLPIVASITLGLMHPKLGQHLTPPTTAATAALPSSWVPVIQDTTIGYPIVGYSTFDLPQCYASAAVAAGMIAFLEDHYRNASFLKIENNNGLSTPSNNNGHFVQQIEANILVNHNKWNVNIQNPTACKGLAGR